MRVTLVDIKDPEDFYGNWQAGILSNFSPFFYSNFSVKFLKVDELYYLSLDPDESCKSKSDNDNDFILSKKLQAFELIV